MLEQRDGLVRLVGLDVQDRQGEQVARVHFLRLLHPRDRRRVARDARPDAAGDRHDTEEHKPAHSLL